MVCCSIISDDCKITFIANPKTSLSFFALLALAIPGFFQAWGNLSDHFVLTNGSDLPFNSVFTATIAKRGDRRLA